MSFGISEQIIEEIRAKSDIVEVISSQVALKRAGSLFKACCPFHNEKTPSFTVNPLRQTFKCFGCGEAGDVFSFLMKYNGMSFTDAVRTLAGKCGVKIEWTGDSDEYVKVKRLLALHSDLASFFRKYLLESPEAETAREYLVSRKLDGEAAERFGIGYAPGTFRAIEQFARDYHFSMNELRDAGIVSESDAPQSSGNGPYIFRFRNRLMFPICDTQGRVIAFSGRILDSSASNAKYVNSPETPIFTKSRVLYALDKAQRGIVSSKNREAVICEGQIDVIRCHVCGFPRAVASQGTAFTPEHASLLKRYADSAVLLFDSDPAGQKAAVRTAGILVAEEIPVRIAHLPEGEDPDSFLLSKAPEEFEKILNASENVINFAVKYFHAAEPFPDSEGAIGRIADNTLEIAARCKNPVHKAKMLQETASLLQIPEQALAMRLETIESKQEKRRTIEKTGQTAHSPAPFKETRIQYTDTPEAARFRKIAAEAESGGHSARIKLYRDICGLLAHNADSEEKLVPFMARYLPPEVIDDPLYAAIIKAYYDSAADSTDHVLGLQQSDPRAAEVLGQIALSPDKVSDKESFTLRDIAHELVLSAWKNKLGDIAKSVEDGSDGSRFAILVDMKKLSNWEDGEKIVSKYMPQLRSEVGSPGPEAGEN